MWLVIWALTFLVLENIKLHIFQRFWRTLNLKTLEEDTFGIRERESNYSCHWNPSHCTQYNSKTIWRPEMTCQTSAQHCKDNGVFRGLRCHGTRLFCMFMYHGELVERRHRVDKTWSCNVLFLSGFCFELDLSFFSGTKIKYPFPLEFSTSLSTCQKCFWDDEFMVSLDLSQY